MGRKCLKKTTHINIFLCSVYIFFAILFYILFFTFSVCIFMDCLTLSKYFHFICPCYQQEETCKNLCLQNALIVYFNRLITKKSLVNWFFKCWQQSRSPTLRNLKILIVNKKRMFRQICTHDYKNTFYDSNIVIFFFL